MTEPKQTVDTPLELMQLGQPEPISMLPETVAWGVLLALLLAAAFLLVWRRYQVYQKALWKRQALALAVKAKGRARADTWFGLIKRVLLVHRSRAVVLKLDDSQLLALFPGLNDRVREALIAGHFQSKNRIIDEDNEALYAAFLRWLNELPVEANAQEKADV